MFILNRLLFQRESQYRGHKSVKGHLRCSELSDSARSLSLPHIMFNYPSFLTYVTTSFITYTVRVFIILLFITFATFIERYASWLVRSKLAPAAKSLSCPTSPRRGYAAAAPPPPPTEPAAAQEWNLKFSGE